MCPFRHSDNLSARVRRLLGSSRNARAITFALCKQSPDDARRLGGERHGSNLVGAPREQLSKPRVFDAAHPFVSQPCAGADDQQRPNRAIALFGDGAGSLLAASPQLPRREPEPGGELRGAREALPVVHLELEDELEGLRDQFNDLAERVDFAERMLAQQRERPQLPRG